MSNLTADGEPVKSARMFGVEMDDLLAGIEQMRRRLCTYDMGGDFPPPTTCDCKFGASGNGEQTGCPELRQAVAYLRGDYDSVDLFRDYAEKNARGTLAQIRRLLAVRDGE